MGTKPETPQIPPRVDMHSIPSFLTGRNQNDYKALSDWLFSFFFWRAMDGKEEALKDPYVLERAIAEARLMALKQTNHLISVTEAAFRYQVSLANKYLWYQFWEAENIEDMLSQILDHEDQRSKIYDLKNWLSLIPALKQLGVSEDDLHGVPLYFEKARASLPVINSLLGQKDEKLAEQGVYEVLRDISDTSISVSKMRDNNFRRLGKVKFGNDIPLANAKVFMLGATDLILIEARRSQTTAIENKLKGIAEGFDIRDAVSVLAEMNHMVSRSRERTWIQMKAANGKYAIERCDEGKGFQVPTPTYLTELIMGEVYHSISLINQMIAGGIGPVVPVYEFINSVSQEDLPTITMRNFNTDADLQKINECFQLFYRDCVPEDVKKLFPDQCLSINIGVSPHSRMFGIFLSVASQNPEASGF